MTPGKVALLLCHGYLSTGRDGFSSMAATGQARRKYCAGHGGNSCGGQTGADSRTDAEQQDRRVAAPHRNSPPIRETTRGAVEAERGYQGRGRSGGKPKPERLRQDGGRRVSVVRSMVGAAASKGHREANRKARRVRCDRRRSVCPGPVSL